MSDHDPTNDDRRPDEQAADYLEPSPSTGWRAVYHTLDVPAPDAGGVRR